MAETEKVGTVRKCPACGAPVESFQTRCSSCGHEFNAIKSSETVQEFFQKLEALSTLEYRANKTREMNEARANTYQPPQKVGAGKVFLWIFFFWLMWIPIVFKKAKGPYATALAVFAVAAFFSLILMLPKPETTTQISDSGTEQVINEVGQQSTSEIPTFVKVGILVISLIGMAVIFIIMKPKVTPEDQRRKSMIEMFPIPNSKEDLTEFAILASGQIKQVNPLLGKFSLQAKRQFWLNEIWVTKFNQVYTKARIAMKDDPNGLNAISQLMTEAGIKK